MLPHLDSLPVPTPPNHLVSLLSDTRSFVFVDKQTLSEGAHHLIAESFRLRKLDNSETVIPSEVEESRFGQHAVKGCDPDVRINHYPGLIYVSESTVRIAILL